MFAAFLHPPGMSIVNNDLLEEYFQVGSAYTVRMPGTLTFNGDFESAESHQPDLPTLQLDESKVAELFNPFPDAIFEVDGLTSQNADIMYTYHSTNPDSMELEGMAVGLTYNNQVVLLTFPLYAMEPYDNVKLLAEYCLDYVRGAQWGVEGDDPVENLPARFSLYQNYPNPFNNSTNIVFEIPALARIKLSVYNILGEEIAVLSDRQLQPGMHVIEFDGGTLASGIYFIRMQGDDFSAVRKIVMLK